MGAGQTTGRLSMGAQMVLSLIRGWCRASLKTRGEPVARVSRRRLAELTNRSLRSVQRFLRELRDQGEIEIEEQPGDWNLYRLGGPGGGDKADSPGGDKADSPPALPPCIDLGLTQLQLSAGAAAERADCTEETGCAGPEVRADQPGEALRLLTGAGLTESVARPFAEADADGLCRVATAYFAEVAATKDKLRRPVTLGLLVAMLRKPDEYFHRAPHAEVSSIAAGTWLPPVKSMIFKSLKQAERHLAQTEQREQRRLHELTLRQWDETLADRPARDAAEWAALPESDRRGIEQGVARQCPTLTPGAELFLAACYRWMRRYRAAVAREAAWQALTEADRATLEATARQRFPLWAATAEGLHSACLTLMPEPAPEPPSA